MSDRPPRTVVSVCEAHINRKVLDPTDRRHVLAQLEAEGHKRIEAFLFEAILDRLIYKCSTKEFVGLGWSFQYDNANVPRFWFKLLLPGDTWNVCDDKVLRFLVDNRCQIVRVSYDIEQVEFFAEHYTGSEWSQVQPLNSVLSRLTEQNQPSAGPRNYSHINYQAQRRALTAIEKTFTDEELLHLSISRTLVNCYLFPWFAKQPMDIDICYLHDSTLRFVEFKRKYPTRKNTFVIDEHPHATLSDWLTKAQSQLTHIILCDPLWNKNVSPLHLLDVNSQTRPYAKWLGTVLDKSVFTGQSLKTSGSDSGMFGGQRSQRELSIDAFWDLGAGLDPQRLCSFLNGERNMQNARINDLIDNRDKARKAYNR